MDLATRLGRPCDYVSLCCPGCGRLAANCFRICRRMGPMVVWAAPTCDHFDPALHRQPLQVKVWLKERPESIPLGLWEIGVRGRG
jgi:hypothetical protein